jgi:hypothetical protein
MRKANLLLVISYMLLVACIVIEDREASYKDCLLEDYKSMIVEAPEVLIAPTPEQFISDEFYQIALSKYEVRGNWSTPSPEEYCGR